MANIFRLKKFINDTIARTWQTMEYVTSRRYNPQKKRKNTCFRPFAPAACSWEC